MLEALHISKAETVYFGDDNDDIEPIQMCGTGVAVANAIAAAINEADYVAGSNDGAVRMLSTWRYNVSLLPLTKILYNVPWVGKFGKPL